MKIKIKIQLKAKLNLKLKDLWTKEIKNKNNLKIIKFYNNNKKKKKKIHWNNWDKFSIVYKIMIKLEIEHLVID